MKINLSKNKKISNKGITLIALVITIIVLLILAGVSIATLTGENGILTQASNAKTETEKAEAKERVQLEVLGSYDTTGSINTDLLTENLANVEGLTYNGLAVDKNTNPITSLPVTVVVDGQNLEIKANGTVGKGKPLVTEAPTTVKVSENTKYKDASSDNKIAVIPAGFSVVPGCTTIDEGLVISDVANDTENAGNQFVWIPVNDANKFERRAGYMNGILQDITSYGEAGRTGTNTNANITESATTQAEAKAMYQSVSDNGGFYIGRYEAGKETTIAENGTMTTTVVSKKGVSAYKNIGWNNDTVNNDITVETGGAVELARNFAASKGYDTTKVHSTLCYGVQWDTALNFIDPGYTGYAKDSTAMGWGSENYGSTEDGNTESNPDRITGKDLIYNSNTSVIANKHKNIYDMAGNVYEWTMEACDDYMLLRVFRGGSSANTLSYLPASNRIVTNSSHTYGYSIGFRVAMYIG